MIQACTMLEGKDLGDAIEAARIKKDVSKKAMADHFGVKPPSIQDWVKHGRIKKDKLMELFKYFSDVAGPEHWGLTPQDSEVGYLFYQDTLAKLSPSVLKALRNLSLQPADVQEGAVDAIAHLLDDQKRLLDSENQ
jgi:hypothetical protein|tara:strand:+ start:37968 stop:38375 length:408 start_codon:yes stop_codon:yes gene_type:complete